MNLPDDIFPEDKVDPTVKKQNEMSVEDTLGIINHLRSSTRKRRASLWRYLVVPAGEDGAAKVRSTYALPETALVENNGEEWAAWAGPVDGVPTFPAFEKIEQEDPLTAAVVAAAPPGTAIQSEAVVQSEADDRMAAYERARAERLDTKADDSAATWAYTTKIVDGVPSFKNLEPGHHVAQIHPNGDIAAIWLGKGNPTRPAFPDALPNLKNGNGALKTYPELVDVRELPPKDRIVVPETSLHELGLKLYGMSKEPVFHEKLRAFLLHVSDTLHAEAAKIETQKVRSIYDRKK